MDDAERVIAIGSERMMAARGAHGQLRAADV